MGRAWPSAIESTSAAAHAAFGSGAASTASSQRNAEATRTGCLPFQNARDGIAQAGEIPCRQPSSGVRDKILIARSAIVPSGRISASGATGTIATCSIT